MTEKLASTIYDGLSIPKMIKLLKHTFRECEFNDVQNVLMERENKMKVEIENLIKERDAVKKEACLLERSHSLAELEKFKLEEKLQRSQTKCEELKKTITRLTEERRAFSDRVKREEEHYDKFSEENTKVLNEKNKLILELNEKINELTNKNLESERLVRDRVVINEEVYQLERSHSSVDLARFKLEETRQRSQRKWEELNETITRLIEEQMASSDGVKRAEEHCNKVCEENSKVLNEKNKLILELNEKINELKNKNLESERLVRDHAVIKEETRQLEKSHSLADLAKLKLEEKCQRKWEELNETITKLIEEQRASSDRVKRAEEHCNKVCEENSKVLNEKNKIIFELNEKINELKNKNLESERLVEVYQQKFESLLTLLEKMRQEIEDLRREKLALNQNVEELSEKQLETDQVVEELKRKNLEVTQFANELRLKKMESDEAVELYKSRVESLEPRIKKVEAELANMLNSKVDDLSNLVDTIDLFAAAQGENVELPDIFKDAFGNGSTDADAEDIVVMSPGVFSTSNSTGSGGIGLPKKGGRNLVDSLTKVDDTNMVRTSSGWNPPHVENNGTAQDNESEESPVPGSDANIMHSDGGMLVRGKSKFGARCSHKMACSSFAVGDVIEICDSDNERNAGDTTYFSDTSSGRTNKRNRTDCRGDSPVNLIKMRKRRICISDDEDDVPNEKENEVLNSTHDRTASVDNDVSVKPTLDTGVPQPTLPSGGCSLPSKRQEGSGAACDSQTVDSTDSDDESCSDAHLQNLVATLQIRTQNRI